MPRTKIILGWEYHEPVKFMWVVETNWMQTINTDILRCDTAAKEHGCGTWLIESQQGNISHWYGFLPIVDEINPSNWTESVYKKKQIIDLNNT